MTSDPVSANAPEPTSARRRSGSRVARVRGRLSLPTLRRSTSLLDGRHRSVFVGHGQDFDDLSNYRPGDDVTDIDWKASARIGQPVIKRYQRESNLPLVLAVDTGRTMAAQAPSGEDKRELVLAVAEVFAYLARLRGDTVALVAADTARVVSRPPRAGSEHTEMILSLVQRQLDALTRGDELAPGAPGPALSTLLERVGTWHRRRSLVVLITDTSHPDAGSDPAVTDRLRRLSAQHELIAIQIADDTPLAPGRGRARDVELTGEIPAFLREDAKLAAGLAATEGARRAAVTALLDARHIEHTAIHSDATLVDSIASLLARQRLASRRGGGRR
ncbi:MULTISPECIES: DUF58 domain-containing protein [unclassified Actinomyces]|uniref:DUF58 domain-containing protein n=1 Tax=unclassified Actinomyces TaxID=2609248 RepID=UPI000D59C929|nr:MULTISPECIES: DUF58 domain-containing protein [unclassified Actinomyces]RAX21035.1 DUF58 domain-containing protein [Actinomyces sp. Z3]RAX24268.1 DUF58 domain-containing protein [Actinomyces sp. Z5]